MIPATPAPVAAPVVPSKVDAATPRATITDTSKPGSTSMIFPDFVGTDRVGAPKAPEKSGDTPTAPASADSASVPAVPPTAPTDVIDLAALSGKKVTLKIDGKEEVVAVEEAFRRAQLDTTLTARSQALAAKEHEVNEREKALRTHPPSADAPAGQPDLSKSIIADDPAIQLVLKQMADLKADNERLKALTTPAREDANMRFLAEEVRKITGQDDFLKYKDSLLAEFKALPLDQQKSADNTLWWVGRYSARKFETLAKQPVPATSAQPVRPGAPMRGDFAGGGGSTSASIPATSAQQAATSAAFQQAQKSGNIDDWAYFERLRREAQTSA